MDLWIESQLNKLIKVHNIQVNFESIICFDVSEGIVYLGEYPTKERALEILKEMKKYLMNSSNENCNLVFTMPEK